MIYTTKKGFRKEEYSNQILLLSNNFKLYSTLKKTISQLLNHFMVLKTNFQFSFVFLWNVRNRNSGRSWSKRNKRWMAPLFRFGMVSVYLIKVPKRRAISVLKFGIRHHSLPIRSLPFTQVLQKLWSRYTVAVGLN